jgi:hypothetical protein
MRRFELHRDEDVSGVSGTGIVAEGVAFSDGGPVALRWTSEWPTSVVFHDRGVESLEAVHGHNGRTRIVWIDLDDPSGPGEPPKGLNEAVAEATYALGDHLHEWADASVDLREKYRSAVAKSSAAWGVDRVLADWITKADESEGEK